MKNGEHETFDILNNSIRSRKNTEVMPFKIL